MANRTRSYPNSPTFDTLVIITVVFIIQLVLVAIGIGTAAVALALPFTERPWTLITSVYAHASLNHLLMNAMALGIFGLIVERRTSRARFHGFILGSGSIAGAAEVLVAGFLGHAVLVLGISGAVFALMGYVVAANPMSAAILGRFKPSRRVQIVLVIVLAGAITILTAADGVALIAHFIGFVIGLVSGRYRILIDR